VDSVWAALETTGTVFALGRDVLAAHCPVCRVGTLSVRLIDADPPAVRLNGCSAGCSAEQLLAVL
jgi:hypothetical protein